MKLAAVLAILAFGISKSFAGDRDTVELHAHLFMKEGMSWMFTGDFNGPLRAKDWTALFSSEANPETVNRSEIGVLVVSFYATPLLTLSLRDSVRRQIALTERFVRENPQWVIARDPLEARAALGAGKRVIVLSLEGASGILDTEEDLKEFVDQKGIRIVTLHHMTDDRYGGVAFLPGLKSLSTPWAFLTQLFHPEHDSDGVRVNANGLTPEGHAFAEALIRRHVWIDMTHGSDKAQRELAEIQLAHGLPLLYTHTSSRKYLRAERGISESQLEALAKSGGYLGVLPSETMLVGTPVPKTMCAADCKKPCEGGPQALAVQYTEFANRLGAESVAFGSDYNGGVQHLKPSCPVGTELDAEGLWNIGQVGAIWDSLEKLDAPVPKPRSKMVDRFLATWARVNPGTVAGLASGSK
jgi:microsomal dipeptidase-like Zn-dependent dipeptidase